jgi:hypothetical protein
MVCADKSGFVVKIVAAKAAGASFPHEKINPRKPQCLRQGFTQSQALELETWVLFAADAQVSDDANRESRRSLGEEPRRMIVSYIPSPRVREVRPPTSR